MADPESVTRVVVGAAEVVAVRELLMPTSVRWLWPDHEAPFDVLDRARPWLAPHILNERGHLAQSIQSYVVRAGDLAVVIDTGVGNDKPREGGFEGWHMRSGPFLDHLAAVIAPGEVDIVINTHMHGDHVGWNTRLQDGDWVPTFPHARYLFVDPEWAYWRGEADRGGATRQLVDDSLRPLLDAGSVDLIPADHRISDELWLEPSHGHTPGHVSVRLSAGGGEAVFIGDALHSPIQCADPDARPALDRPEFAAAARETRRRILDRYADGDVLVFGAHFAASGGGRVLRDGDAFRFETIPGTARG